MTGPMESIIGMNIEVALKRFRKGTPTKYELATGKQQINGITLSIDENSGNCTHIERIYIREK